MIGSNFASLGAKVRARSAAFVNNANAIVMIGIMAIREWNLQALEKYKYTIEPLRLSLEPDKTLVTGRVTGNFPGSPIDLRFIFSLEGDKIASLQIRP